MFLGRDYGSTPDYSDRVAGEIDEEIRSIVEDAMSKCEALLKEHMDKLHMIAKYLMKYEKIDGIDFDKLMKGEITVSDDEPVQSEESDSSTEE